MTSKYGILYPTGVYIPMEKQSIFMLAFNDMLVSTYNIQPVFGPATSDSSCEVKFDYLRNKSYNPGSYMPDLEKAMAFLKENLSVLGPKIFSRKRKKSRMLSTSLKKIPPQVINLEDESEEKTVDLTDIDRGEPEIIILDDSLIHTDKRNRLNTSVVDLTGFNESFNSPERRKKIENVKKSKLQISPCRSTPVNGMKGPNTLNKPNSCKKRMRKCKKRKNINRISQTVTSSSSSTLSRSSTSISSNDSLPKKKRKLQDISNIHSTKALSSKSSTSVETSNLSENVQKYFENISKVVSKSQQENPTFSTDSFNVGNHMVSSGKRKHENPTRKNSPLIINLEGNKKRKVFTPQNRFKQWSHPKILKNSPRRLGRIFQQIARTSKRIEGTIERNAFNPNPLEVDLEGLRPIVIDGCNVAMCHGRGKFSGKGLKICVDYFTSKGHSTIKVFLPQFRQKDFSAELLEELRAKSDVVFTPTLSVNGQRRTPYDDRFIVQYATEFGGVIVSTDNYRDLLRENPRWQDTIEKRLLMFTWVDDFLMFPVDPLGRKGPTLEEFLRF